jgi:hypothetical protein
VRRGVACDQVQDLARTVVDARAAGQRPCAHHDTLGLAAAQGAIRQTGSEPGVVGEDRPRADQHGVARGAKRVVIVARLPGGDPCAGAVATGPPSSWVNRRAGTLAAVLPANVSENVRATVTAGCANEVELVNQCAARCRRPRRSRRGSCRPRGAFRPRSR